MKKTLVKRLRVNSQTLRVMHEVELERVQGGAGVGASGSYPAPMSCGGCYTKNCNVSVSCDGTC